MVPENEFIILKTDKEKESSIYPVFPVYTVSQCNQIVKKGSLSL